MKKTYITPEGKAYKIHIKRGIMLSTSATTLSADDFVNDYTIDTKEDKSSNSLWNEMW